MITDVTRIVYRALRRGLRLRQSNEPVSSELGLTTMQWARLLAVTWSPDQALHLVFGDGCQLPLTLRVAGGIDMPVVAVRGSPGRLHAWFRVQNASTLDPGGTLTALVLQRHSNRIYALTAGHVVAAADASAPGDRIALQENTSGRGVYGKLDYWTPSFHAGLASASVDAGLVRLPLQQAQALLDIGVRFPAGVGDIYIGDTLSLRTRGTAIPLRITGVTTAILALDSQGAQVQLAEGVAYLADSAPLPGDSGAPLWDQHDRLAAMHIGGQLDGAAANGIAIPIRRALDWGGCVALERGMSLFNLPAAAVVPPPATPVALAPTGPVMVSPAPASSPGQLTLARTLWGEARGEGTLGMEAVACVVMNRIRRQTYWGKDVDDVCRKPYQFSCWNPSDPNSAKLTRLVATSPDLATPLAIAGRALANQLADMTVGATHYHARNLAPPPRWARGRVPCAVIGRHLFYNNIN